jgi:membrane protease YdiL (CAAX protease family)
MNRDSVVGQLARLAFAILGGMMLAWLITLVILLVKASFDVQTAFLQANSLLESTGMLRLLQAVQSVCIFVFPPFLFYFMNEVHPIQALQFRKPSGEKLLLAVLSLVVAIPLINALVIWNESMQLPSFLSGVEEWMRIAEKKAEDLTLKMMSGTAWYDLAFSLLIVAVLAGFGEELLFRGLLQGTLVKLMCKKYRMVDGSVPTWVMHVSIWTIAFLFSSIHLQFFGFIPRLLLGAWFGYLLWWTGSIWVPMLAHMTNNALSAFFLFAETKGWVSESPDNLGTADTSWMSVLSLLLLSACAVLLKRKSKPNNC